MNVVNYKFLTPLNSSRSEDERSGFNWGWCRHHPGEILRKAEGVAEQRISRGLRFTKLARLANEI